MARFNEACGRTLQSNGRRSCCCGIPMLALDETDIAQAAHEMSVYYNYFFAWFKNEKPIHQA